MAGYTAAEWNVAVAGSLPSSVNTSTDCVSITGSTVCYEAYGDRWWVKDTAADSASAVADWENIVSTTTDIRNGQCVNSLGNGKWGYCNKNYVENSILFVEAKVYDASEDEWLPQVSNSKTFFA